MTLVLAIISLVVSLYLLSGIFQRHTGVTRWIFVEIVYNCFIKYMVGYLGFPSFLNYGSDFILIIIIYLYIYHNQKILRKANRYRIPASAYLTVLLFFSVCLVSWLVNAYSPMLFFWGFRNNFRFLIFLLICAATLRKEDIYELVDVLYVFILLNVVVVTYQSTTMSSGFGSAYGDYVSGLFSNGGDSRGGNASLDWLMCIVTTAAIVRYLNREKGFAYALVAVVCCLYIAALNETKLFFVQIAVIVVLSLFLAKKSLKTVLIAVVAFIGLFAGIQILYSLFPHFAGFFTLENMLDYASNDSGYTRGGAINRFNSIPYVLDNFLNEPLETAFGIGLGNADYSSNFSFLTSSFYRVYGWTAYQWFMVPMVTVETGIVGLACYFLIILNCFRVGLVNIIRNHDATPQLQIAVIVCVIAVMMAVCNQSLRLESMGYAAWLFMGIPFVVGRSIANEDEEGFTGPLPGSSNYLSRRAM